MCGWDMMWGGICVCDVICDVICEVWVGCVDGI